MNFWSILSTLMQYSEEIAPHARGIFAVILPIIPKIIQGLVGPSIKIGHVTISAYAKTGSPVHLSLSEIALGLESFIAGKQVEVISGDTIVTITPDGVPVNPPSLNPIG